MTYRERRERRAERLRGWADKRRTKSAAAFKTADTIASGIPFGQPILVGHHSEKRHRRDLERIDSGMRRGIEHQHKAASMESRADEIDRQADRAIYSDDPDAIEQLEARIADLEAQRERIKTVNKAVRKHGLEKLVGAGAPFELTDPEKRELINLVRLCPYHQADTRGFPAYTLSNLGGNISRQRARLEALREQRRLESDGRPTHLHSSDPRFCGAPMPRKFSPNPDRVTCETCRERMTAAPEQLEAPHD